jgi:quinol monooxygenase YgiN
MATMFLRHKVADYKAWRKEYDKHPDFQKASGITVATVYQADDDPNDVTVVHEFTSMAAARAFVKNPDLAAAMKAAGVVGTPTFWCTTAI